MSAFPVYYQCLLLLLIVSACLSDILIVKNGSNTTIEVIGDLPALFGPSLPIGGLKGYVVYTSPPDACVLPDGPPKFSKYKGPFIALVRRYNCTFVQKVLNAQTAGYQAVIVRNVGSDSIEVMSGDHDTELVRIPSVFIGENDGLEIQNSFLYESGYYAIVTDELPFNIQNYLLPFAITIGICFILMLLLMLLKCMRDYQRTRRNRLSSRALKKLPIHKFKKGDPYECCAVCLEDYADNEKLRILPCGHAYHSKCIDPWLTKNRRVCPVCKRKVITGDENPSDLESDSEDETAPLINSEGGTQGGTFSQQRENPFQEAERQAEQRRQEESVRNEQTARNYARLEETSDSDSDEEEPQWMTTTSGSSETGTEESSPGAAASTPHSYPPEVDSTVLVEDVHVEGVSGNNSSPPNDCIV